MFTKPRDLAPSLRAPSRRALLAGGAGMGALGLGLAGLGISARAETSDVLPSDLRFLFVVAAGGWDVTRVFAPLFGLASVDMEAGASEARIGAMSWVDHPERPSVRAFFERWYAETLLLNGILVPSVGHEECMRLLLTGEGSGVQPDWAIQIAAQGSDRFALPAVTIRGPDYPGSLGALRTRIGADGRLGALLDGSLMAEADPLNAVPSALPPPDAQAEIERWLAARAAAAESQALAASSASPSSSASSSPSLWATRATQARIALERAQTIEALAGEIGWDIDTSLVSQADLAIELLSRGLSRCLTLQHGEHDTWDSHAGNDWYQTRNFEDLFSGLIHLRERLEATPGRSGATLAEEVVVVVLSEMGRTPRINGGDGKDHWGYTSAMLWGPAVAGGRVIGGFDDYFYGQPVDPPSGVITPSGRRLTAADLGATLLTLAGVSLPAHLNSAALLTSLQG